MKVIALLLSVFAVLARAEVRKPTTFVRGLDVRGGAAIGPLDGDLAMQLSKTGAVAFIAGSASKYIASQTGGTATQLADYITSECFALNALCAAVATGMYSIGDTGYSSLKVLAAANALALILKCDTSGFSVETLQNNATDTLWTLALLYIAFA